MGINSYTYPREQFYADIQAYIRFKTPGLSLADLIDPKNDVTPYNRMRHLLTQTSATTPERVFAQISYELRLLGCLIRANLRDRVMDLCRPLLQTVRRPPPTPYARPHSDASSDIFLRETDDVLGAFRQLRHQFSGTHIPPRLRSVYDYLDEYLSLTLEYYLTVLLDHIDHANPQGPAEAVSRRAIAQAITREQDIRQTTPYAPDTASPAGNETFLYRRGLLKKFVMSVLFLDIRKERENRAADLFAAIAAGIATLFATGAAIATQRWYTLNSLPFIAAVALSYILKDRMKDWVKHYFAAKLTRWLWDYNVRIEDPTKGVKIGRCREAFCFLGQHLVPPEVYRRRHDNAVDGIELEFRSESIIRYEKDVQLQGKTIGALHPRLHEINDIIRFNISSFLTRADDPVRAVRWFDAEHNRVATVESPKLYHINIVFVLRSHTGKRPSRIERVRIILDKTGIKRIESV